MNVEAVAQSAFRCTFHGHVADGPVERWCHRAETVGMLPNQSDELLEIGDREERRASGKPRRYAPFEMDFRQSEFRSPRTDLP